MKKKKIIISIGIMVAVLSIVGVSYALWTNTDVQTKKNLIQLECFNVQFSEITDSNIQLTNAFPLTDAEGKEIDPYHFTISNQCESYASYQVRIEIKNDSKLDDNYIKVMLNQNNPNILTNANFEESSKRIGDNTKKAYIIETGFLDAKETKEYDLRLWLDESVTTSSKNQDGSDVQNSHWGGIVTVSSMYAEEKNTVLANLEFPIVTEGNGLYEVKHTAEETAGMDPGWQQTEYRFRGVGFLDINIYSFYYNNGGTHGYYSSIEQCQSDNVENEGEGECKILLTPTGEDYVHNYVTFNDEQWRIIGLVNVQTNNGIEQRLKIIRDDSIGSYSWDESNINDWTQASLMKKLNESEGEYYQTLGNLAKSMIDNNLVWNIAGVNGGGYSELDVNQWYEQERASIVNTVDGPSSGPTTWSNGKVGLMYPSDYLYATGLAERATCLQSRDDFKEYSCFKNNWLYFSDYEWLLTPQPIENTGGGFHIYPDDGIIVDTSYVGTGVSDTYEVRPVVYLKPAVQIVGGTGSITDEYKLDLIMALEDVVKTSDIVNSGDGLYEVTHTDQTTMESEWQATELRYAGANPNNYITFNNEKWRIIGLVNVKTTNGIEQRLKIIRADSIGDYSWDHKSSGIGSSDSDYGSNDWTDSQLMEMLNGIYYNSQNGECWTGISDSSSSKDTCNFTQSSSGVKGLNSTAQGMIDKEIIWNLGGTGSYTSASNGLVTHWYGYERGTTVYNNRPTEWQASNTAKASSETTSEKVLDSGLFRSIALPYPSDYGYATSGGSTGRAACLAKEIVSWDSMTDCGNNDWLKPSGYMWTLSPYSSDSLYGFDVYYDGSVRSTGATDASRGVWPALYLKPNIRVTNLDKADGSADYPYELALVE